MSIKPNPFRTSIRDIRDFLFFVFRESIEPIILVSGLTLLYSLFQRIRDTSQETGQNFLLAINADFKENAMIYFILIVIFGVWISYRIWRDSSANKRYSDLLDELVYHRSILLSLKETLEGLRQDSKERGGQDGDKRSSL